LSGEPGDVTQFPGAGAEGGGGSGEDGSGSSTGSPSHKGFLSKATGYMNHLKVKPTRSNLNKVPVGSSKYTS